MKNKEFVNKWKLRLNAYAAVWADAYSVQPPGESSKAREKMLIIKEMLEDFNNIKEL